MAKAETQLKEEKFSEKQELLVQQMVCSLVYFGNFHIHQVKEFKTRLKAAKYHGTYFDRSSEKKRKICDDTGKPAIKMGFPVRISYRVFFNTGPPPKISKYRKVNIC